MKLTLANLKAAILEGANLKGTNIREAHYLTFDQLSKVESISLNKIRRRDSQPTKREAL